MIDEVLVNIMLGVRGPLSMSGDESRSMKSTTSVPLIYWLAAILLIAAMAWRMQGITQWPMPYHPTLQYENALNTRAIWYHLKGENAAAEEKHWLTGYQGRQKGLWLVETLAAGTYALCGQEVPWVSGIFCCLIWMAAALFLFDIANRFLRSHLGAFAAACFLIVQPFGLVISRSYQHESAQMLGLLLGWWWLARCDACKNWRTALIAGLVWGIAMLLKPGIGWIPLCFVHLAYGIERKGWRHTLANPWFYVVPIIALIPSLLWMKFILVSDETHQWKWRLLLDWQWYEQTWNNIVSVTGWFSIWTLLAVTAWMLFRQRWFFPLLFAGFTAYAAVFNYACMTHDYYVLPIFPILALAWGQLLAGLLSIDFFAEHDNRLMPGARSILKQSSALLVIGGATVFCTYIGSWHGLLLTAGPYEPEQKISRELGKQLGMGTKIIALTNDYAMPLSYFSGLHAQWWPTAGDLWYEGLAGGRVVPAKERLERLLKEGKGQYFVITLEEEYRQQPDLAKALEKCSELSVHPDGVRIFRLQP